MKAPASRLDRAPTPCTIHALHRIRGGAGAGDTDAGGDVATSVEKTKHDTVKNTISNVR